MFLLRLKVLLLLGIHVLLVCGNIDLSIPDFQQPDGTYCVLFGSHHKMGSDFCRTLGKEIDRAASWKSAMKKLPEKKYGRKNHLEVRYVEEYIKRSEEIAAIPKIVHLVRSPINTILSAYCYHLVSSESWLHDPTNVKLLYKDDPLLQNLTGNWTTYAQLLHQVPRDIGIRIQYKQSMSSILEAIDTLQYMHEHGYESFPLEEFLYSYDSALHRLLNVLNVKNTTRERAWMPMRQQDIAWMDKDIVEHSDHFTHDKCNKTGLVDTLIQYYARELEDLTIRTLYPWYPDGMKASISGAFHRFNNIERLNQPHGVSNGPDFIIFGMDRLAVESFGEVVEQVFSKDKVRLVHTKRHIWSHYMYVDVNMDQMYERKMIQQYQQAFQGAHHPNALIGHVDPFESMCWHVPARMVGLFPHTKPVFVIRDPLQKVLQTFQYCADTHKVTTGLTISFAMEIQSQVERIEHCDATFDSSPDTYKMAFCYLETSQFCMKSDMNVHTVMCRHNVQLGMYSVFLKQWLQHYPHLHVILWEEYLENRLDALKGFIEALGVDADRDMFRTFPEDVADDDDNIRRKDMSEDDLAMIDRVDEFYQPYNAKLNELLQRDTGYNARPTWQQRDQQ